MTDKTTTLGSADALTTVTGGYDVYAENQARIDPPAISLVQDLVGDIQGDNYSGSTIDDTHPTLRGDAAPNSEVNIYNGNQLIGTVTANEYGGWYVQVDLPPGAYHLVAVGTDGQTSAPFDVTVVTAQVDPAPVINTVYGADATQGGFVSSGGTTDAKHPNIMGTAKPNSIVTIYDGDMNHPIGTAQVDPWGSWQFMPTTSLSDGVHNFIAATSSSAPSAAFVIDVEALASTPASAAITGVYDHVGLSQGLVGQGTTIDDNKPTLSGTGEPNTTVTILDNGRTLGTAQVDGNGHWEMTPKQPMGDGFHDLLLKSANGTVGGEFIIMIDATPPVTGEMPPQILYAYDTAHPEAGMWNNGATTSDTHPTLQGSATPNSLVTVYDGDQDHPIGTAQTNANGQWQFTPAATLSDGVHHFIATTEHSPVSSDFVVTIIPGSGGGEVPAITGAFDYAGTQQGVVNPGDTTDDTHPTLFGTGAPNSMVTIYDGDLSHVLGTAPVYPDGHWSFTPDGVLGNGVHNLIAAGADGTASAPFVITIDAATPPPIATPALSIDIALDNTGGTHHALTNGAHTDDTAPMLQGSGAPNSVVIVSDGQHVLGTATTNDFGNWMFTPEKPLDPGTHQFTVADASGSSSAPYTITIDTPFSAPVIDHAHDNIAGSQGDLVSGGVVHDTHPLLSGYAPAGSIVTIADGDQTLGVARANAKGEWTFTPELSDGVHNLTASTVSGTSDPFVLTVETSTANSQMTGLSVADVLHGGETELFAAPSAHDDARLSVHDVSGNGSVMGDATAHAPAAMAHDVATLNANLVLPHEQMHAHAM